MAAVIGARIGNQLRQTLEIKRTVFWSDSQIVLHWLSSSKPLCKFVKKRVNEINDATQDGEWRYVPTDSNPADLQTRGLSGKHFKESTLWMRGPNWISDETCWPAWIPSVTHETSMLMTTDVNAHGESLDFAALPGISKIMDISRFSSLRKLVRVTSYVLKFVKQCRKKRAYNLRSTDARKPEEITSDDVQTATRLWIIDVQNEPFTREKDLISKNMQSKGSPLLKQLRLFVDEHGVIRCAGRIHNSPLDDCAKFPVLLPKKHRLTDLVILDTHRKLLHSGAGLTITEIRQNYWIPSIRQCVNHMLRTCVPCRKTVGKPYAKPDSPPLPKDRVTDVTLFTTTGVDFAGPLYVKDNGGILKKMYICLFTCACVRAVHLELVPDMTLDSFMLAFRRFVSGKGTPKTVYIMRPPSFRLRVKYRRQWTFTLSGSLFQRQRRGMVDGGSVS